MASPVEFPKSIWAATAPERPPTAPLTGTEETDVAVIGAGFTGRSATGLRRAPSRSCGMDYRNSSSPRAEPT